MLTQHIYMFIRESTIEDLPQIIALLKESIGERLTPKTEDYFLWKHEKNPFGRSKILLAVEQDKVIGVRAFMRWRWVSERDSHEAVRAVDTATDPGFQGMGIFKKLTLQAADECKKDGMGLVFNSPNAVSMQGYLKMGWTVSGRLPLYLGAGSLRPRFYSTEAVNNFYTKYAAKNAINKLSINWALSPRGSSLFTPLDHRYLQWRYTDCPVASYGAIIEPGKFGFVFRLKKLNRFLELRICEIWSEAGDADGQQAGKAFQNLKKITRPILISCAPSPLFVSGKKNIVKLFGPFSKGPVITIKPLATANLDSFAGFKNWRPSLGSMELF